MNLNPFKKNKEKKEAAVAEHAEVRAQYLHSLETAVEATEGTADPARRVLQLQALREEITAVESGDMDKIYEKARKSGEKADLATSLSGFAVAGALVPVTGGLSMIAMFPLMIGGTYAGLKRRESVTEKMKAEQEEYVAALEGIRANIDERLTETINNNVEGISASPVYQKVMDHAGLSQQFSSAAAKYVQQLQELKAAAAKEEKEKPAAEKPAAEAPATETPVEIQPHEKQDFTRFTQFGRTTKKPPQP